MISASKQWEAGFAFACAMLVRTFDQPTYAAEMLREIGMTPRRLRTIPLDAYDRKPLLKLFREEHSLKRESE